MVSIVSLTVYLITLQTINKSSYFKLFVPGLTLAVRRPFAWRNYAPIYSPVFSPLYCSLT